MKCNARSLSLCSLGFGLLATGALALAVSTDYWIYTLERHTISPNDLPWPESGGTGGANNEDFTGTPGPGGMEPGMEPGMGPGMGPGLDTGPGEAMMGDIGDQQMGNDSFNPCGEDPKMCGTPMAFNVRLHAGLWRSCMIYDDEVNVKPECTNIDWSQESTRGEEGADVTNSLLRSIRRAVPVIVISLFVQITGLGLSTVGNAKRDYRTLLGAIFYIFSSLGLAVGVIIYISAVNDEVSHHKQPKNGEQGFAYSYGWAFFFTGASFIFSMSASVANIYLYLRRYSNLEDMVLIVPGLEKRGNFDFFSSHAPTSSEDPDVEWAVPHHSGTQNPTIIL